MSIALPKKMIHPIASLVNPHATLAAAEAKLAEQEYLQSRQDVYTPMRIINSRQQSKKYSKIVLVENYTD
jgi:hypothetical protein